MNRELQHIGSYFLQLGPVVWTTIVFHVQTDIATSDHAPSKSSIHFFQHFLQIGLVQKE
jgi:hypothetical protein